MAKGRGDRLSGPIYSTDRKQPVQFTPSMPAADLTFFVECYWLLAWDLTDQVPYYAEHLPDPSVHVIVEDKISGVFGPARSRFMRLVEGQGWAFCIKFRPGAFYPLTRSLVSSFKNKLLSLHAVFGPAGNDLEAAMRAAARETERIEIAEYFLRSRSPEQDDSVALIHQIIDYITGNPALTRSHDLERQFNLTQRTLQRLFSRYVGVSPSWVIRRYRIHDAVKQLDQGQVLDWPMLAVTLGYFDQAHFIKDFKKLIGVTPGQYVRRVAQNHEHEVGR